MIKKLKERIIKHLDKVAEIKTSPHSIASGFAIGTFIAIFPTFGFGIFIGLIVLFIFKRLSKLSMFASFAIWNPVILALMYPLDYAVGSLVLTGTPTKIYKIEILNYLFVHSRRFLVGSTILAITISLATYLLVLILVDYYQKKNKENKFSYNISPNPINLQ